MVNLITSIQPLVPPICSWLIVPFSEKYFVSSKKKNGRENWGTMHDTFISLTWCNLMKITSLNSYPYWCVVACEIWRNPIKDHMQSIICGHLKILNEMNFFYKMLRTTQMKFQKFSFNWNSGLWEKDWI